MKPKAFLDFKHHLRDVHKSQPVHMKFIRELSEIYSREGLYKISRKRWKELWESFLRSQETEKSK